MYVCLCKGITEQKIIEEVNRNQNATVKEIARRLGLGSDCGICITESIEAIKTNQARVSHSDQQVKKS